MRFLSSVSVSVFAVGLGVLASVMGCTSSGASKSCTLAGCSSGAQVITVAKGTTDQLKASTVKACRNGACSQGTPAIVPSSAGDREEMSLRGAATVQAYITPATDGWTIEAQFPLDDSSPAVNGDTYELTVSDASGAQLGHAGGLAKYTDTTPNGPGCPPICKNATIQ